jgi:hypothetical protein
MQYFSLTEFATGYACLISLDFGVGLMGSWVRSRDTAEDTAGDIGSDGHGARSADSERGSVTVVVAAPRVDGTRKRPRERTRRRWLDENKNCIVDINFGMLAVVDDDKGDGN